MSDCYANVRVISGADATRHMYTRTCMHAHSCAHSFTHAHAHTLQYTIRVGLEGAYADYVTSPESFTSLKPAVLPHGAAATIPEVGSVSFPRPFSLLFLSEQHYPYHYLAESREASCTTLSNFPLFILNKQPNNQTHQQQQLCVPILMTFVV